MLSLFQQGCLSILSTTAIWLVFLFFVFNATTKVTVDSTKRLLCSLFIACALGAPLMGIWSIYGENAYMIFVIPYLMALLYLTIDASRHKQQESQQQHFLILGQKWSSQHMIYLFILGITGFVNATKTEDFDIFRLSSIILVASSLINVRKCLKQQAEESAPATQTQT